MGHAHAGHVVLTLTGKHLAFHVAGNTPDRLNASLIPAYNRPWSFKIKLGLADE
jgi:hypothetical protein